MVAWSTLIKAGVANSQIRGLLSCKKLLATPSTGFNLTHVRNSGHERKFFVTATRWQWHRFKDLVHLYLLIGFIPMGSLLFYVNVFIGPAKLAPIPEGYEPKYWEYYSHPFQRFIARYIHSNPQLHYEKMCHELFEEQEKVMLRRLESNVKEKIKERLDYQAWYYRPVTGKYHRRQKAQLDEIPFHVGE